MSYPGAEPTTGWEVVVVGDRRDGAVRGGAAATADTEALKREQSF